jgi:hypothetical protein
LYNCPKTILSFAPKNYSRLTLRPELNDPKVIKKLF